MTSTADPAPPDAGTPDHAALVGSMPFAVAVGVEITDAAPEEADAVPEDAAVPEEADAAA